MTKRLRIGFLGTGQWANYVARAIGGVADFEMAACYSVDEAERASFAAATGCAICRSEEELLRDSSLDAVCILTPNDLHHDQALRSMAQGLNVFVEKPIASTSGEAASMIAAASKANVRLFVGHNTRRGARFRRMKEMIDAGEIGKPIISHVSFTSSAGLGQQLGSWRYDPKRTRAVALAQIGIHAIDLLNYFFGEPEAVSADIRSSGAAGQIEDLCMARIRFASGVIATFDNAYSVTRDRSLSIMGTAGALFTPHERLLIHRDAKGVDRQIETPDNDTVGEEFEEFAAAIRGNRELETTGEVGALAMAVMEAMICSSESRSEVGVNRISAGNAVE